MAELTLTLTNDDDDELLLELALQVPDEDVDKFRSYLEDYFVGGVCSRSTPNLLIHDVEVL